MTSKGDAIEHFAAFRQTAEYAAWRLRHDLAFLIEQGLKKAGINQRDLGNASGMWESRVSKLIHSQSNCNLSIIARVLHPLGIRPTLVDKAELDALRQAAAFTPESRVLATVAQDISPASTAEQSALGNLIEDKAHDEHAEWFREFERSVEPDFWAISRTRFRRHDAERGKTPRAGTAFRRPY
ncbi:MAG TPA: hypothetical protein VFF69_05260 [Phycisphaerales bacterium]|nr:hypothetical protein [Phycisphaerales bacterium]